MKVYTDKQKNILQMAKYENLPLKKFVNPKFTELEMLAILDGLRDGLDVSAYADNKFNYIQMLELREGMLDGLDISCLLDPDITWKEMEILKEFIKAGFDPKPYIEEKLTSNQLIGLLRILKSPNSENLLKIAKDFNYDLFIVNNAFDYEFSGNDGDVGILGLNRDYNYEQIAIIERSVMFGFSIVNYAFPEMRVSELEELVKGVAQGIDVRRFALPLYTSSQMEVIREAMIAGKDVTYILKPDLSIDEMKERLM